MQRHHRPLQSKSALALGLFSAAVFSTGSGVASANPQVSDASSGAGAGELARADVSFVLGDRPFCPRASWIGNASSVGSAAGLMGRLGTR